IKAQCDGLFALLVKGEGFDEVLQLRCRRGGKPPRYAAPPEDVWLLISPSRGGVIAADRPDQTLGKRSDQVSLYGRQQILDALTDDAQSRSEIARLAEVSPMTAKRRR